MTWCHKQSLLAATNHRCSTPCKTRSKLTVTVGEATSDERRVTMLVRVGRAAAVGVCTARAGGLVLPRRNQLRFADAAEYRTKNRYRTRANGGGGE
jgi:hypothetical protein